MIPRGCLKRSGTGCSPPTSSSNPVESWMTVNTLDPSLREPDGKSALRVALLRAGLEEKEGSLRVRVKTIDSDTRIYSRVFFVTVLRTEEGVVQVD